MLVELHHPTASTHRPHSVGCSACVPTSGRRRQQRSHLGWVQTSTVAARSGPRVWNGFDSCGQQSICSLNHGLKQGFELLLLPEHGAARIERAFQCQAGFWLAEAEEAGAVFETEQGDLDGVCLHAGAC